MSLKTLSLSFFIINLIQQCLSISFYIKRDTCFNKNYEINETLTLSYLVSGEDEKSVKVVLKDPELIEIYSNNNEEDGSFTHHIPSSGVYRVCFYPTSSAENSITFSFLGSFESGNLVNVAKGEEISDMQKDVLSIVGIFQQIEINMKYVIERQSSHFESKNFLSLSSY